MYLILPKCQGQKTKKIREKKNGYPLKIQNKIFGGFFLPTPLKINMEPKNCPIEKKQKTSMILGSNSDFHQDSFTAYNGTYVRTKVQQQHPPRHGKLLQFVARPWDLPPFQGDLLGLDGWMVRRRLGFGVELWLLVRILLVWVLKGFCYKGFVKIFVWKGDVGEGTFCGLSSVGS